MVLPRLDVREVGFHVASSRRAFDRVAKWATKTWTVEVETKLQVEQIAWIVVAVAVAAVAAVDADDDVEIDEVIEKKARRD